jgi:hypothetical protein
VGIAAKEAMMRGNGLFIIGLVVIVSITGVAFHSSQNLKPQFAQTASSQDTPHPAQQLAREKLASLLAPHGVQVPTEAQTFETDSYRKLDVRWEIKAPPQQPMQSEPGRAPAGSLTVKELKIAAGRLPRLRALELAPTQLLVIGVDSNASLRWWHVMTDPRFVRAETVDSTGQLRAYVSYLSRTGFVVAYPDDPAIIELRFYQPEWTGESFALNSLGTLSVR